MILREQQLAYVEALSAKAQQSPTYWAQQLGYPHSQIQKLMRGTIESIGHKSWKKLETLTSITLEEFLYGIPDEKLAGLSTSIISADGDDHDLNEEARLLRYFRNLSQEDKRQVVEFAAIRLAGGKSLREMVLGLEGISEQQV